jgi:retron-type reverse transcriptase
MKLSKNTYQLIIAPENLFAAWNIFKRDKRNRSDVAVFEHHLEEHIFQLHRELQEKTYRHGPYRGFWIHDPKLRRINKTTVRDRVLHHAIFNILNPIFENTLISTAFSCRVGKGTHKGVQEVTKMLRRESRNYTRRCYALKCDVRKFFDSVDHTVLLDLLGRKIKDANTMWLLNEVVSSFASTRNLFQVRGVPIGNLTSQLFANIYMNELDQFVKHELKVKYYARYTDDFVIVSSDRAYLAQLIEPINRFLGEHLMLELHPKKVGIRTDRQGIDFLGYVTLPHYVSVRTKTKRRIFRKLKERVSDFRSDIITKETLLGSLRSYLGVFSHADAHETEEELMNRFWFWLTE